MTSSSGGDPRILRDVLIREIETINEYEEMLANATTPDVRRFLAHAIQEEKEHVAEAMQLLRTLDPMQDRALAEDHSPHFREGGPGARSLASLEEGSPTPAATAGHPAPVAPPPPDAPAPPARAPRGPYVLAPGDRSDQPTVGNLKGKSAASE